MKRILLLFPVCLLIAALTYDLHRWRLYQAYRSFQQGDLRGAHAVWSRLAQAPWDRGEATFNRGVALCRMGNYSAAIGAFRQASTAGDRPLRAAALYNLGTGRLQSAERESGAQAERHLREAVRSLEQATALNPFDAAAAHNLRLARRRLEALAVKKTHEKTVPPQERRIRGPEREGEPRGKINWSASAGTRSGADTDLDREGAKRRATPMEMNRALRLLDEARGRETLRSLVPVSERGGGAPQEKEW
jgi:tetratricopeptide (TPR) repeat protein